MKKTVALLLMFCLLLGGCAQNGAAADPVAPEPAKEDPRPVPTAQEEAKSFRQLALSLAGTPETDADYQDMSLYARAFGGYTDRTAKQIFNGADGNVVYSPANLYLALCMLAETADGESRAQLLSLLGLESVDQARAAAGSLFRTLYRDTETGRTLLANSIWLNEQVDFRQETVDKLANSYFASSFRAPMGSKATDAAIAEWINENTNDLLSDAAANIQTDAQTLMMLISTLYFKGTWHDQFEESFNTKDTFTDASGAAHTVDFMHTFESRSTYLRATGRDNAGYTVAALDFRDGTKMWFLLPDKDTALDPEYMLGGLTLAAQASSEITDPDCTTGLADIEWSVPKFDVGSEMDLIPALQALGVTDVFGSAADFSPLTDLDAVISSVTHAARVKVDEEGCEAAAFTEMSMMATAMRPEPLPCIEMDLNRPFAFLITGADDLPLFLGVVNSVE